MNPLSTISIILLSSMSTKAYFKQYYKKNKRKIIDRSLVRNAKIQAENQGKVCDYLHRHPCVDCGEPDIVVLDFDHRDPEKKSDTIQAMIHSSYSWNTIMKEINKCDVRCANCHRRRTARQFGSYKLVDREGIEPPTPTSSG